MKKQKYVFLLCVVLVGCEKVEWMDTVPQGYRGKWTETSDEIVSGQAEPRQLLIYSNRIVHILPIEDGGRRSVEQTVLRANLTSGAATIFFGAPTKNHIAESRYVLETENNGSFIRVSEIVGNEDIIIPVGRFVEKR